MNKEKEYIEAELIKENKSENFKKKTFNYGANYGEDKFKENLGDLKKGLYWKLFLILWPQILGIILFFVIIFSLVYILFDNPFDHIIAAIILYFLIKALWNLKRFFK